MRFTDEEIIAFLLGDASAELRDQIESQLAEESQMASGDLAERLSTLRLVLGHMDSMSVYYEPPSDLVDATMQRIEDSQAESQVELSSAVGASHGLSASEGSDREKGSNIRKRVESLVLTVCLGAICCLVLPSIVTARFESRKRVCAHGMLLTGQELISFAMQNPDGRYPPISAQGIGSFAGVQPVHLKSAGYNITMSQLRCPSLMGCQASQPRLAIESIPNFEQLRQVAINELAALQRAIGGDFAYNLGIQAQRGEEIAVIASRCEGRSNYAILSDAPLLNDSGETWVAHDGRGVNMMFEDGRVVFVSMPANAAISPLAGRASPAPQSGGAFRGDYPFRNFEGDHAAGLTEEDMCLAPSYISPVAYGK